MSLKQQRAGVLLSAYAANALAVLINEAPQGGPLTKRYAAHSPDDVLLFGYSSRDEVVVDIVGFGPLRSLAYLGGHARVLDSPLTIDLDATAGSTGSSPLAPDVEGMPLVEAGRVATAKRFAAGVGGEELDPFVRFGSVLLQDPPAGFRGIGSQLDLIIAVGREPPCSSSDLVFQYVGAEPMNFLYDMGSVVVRDVSPRACRFPNTVMATGLNAAGKPVTRTVPVGVILTTDTGWDDQSSLIVLSPRANPYVGGGDQVPLSEMLGTLPLTGGSCAKDGLDPASFLLRFPGGRAIVPNVSSLPDEGSLVMCNGEDFGITTRT